MINTLFKDKKEQLSLSQSLLQRETIKELSSMQPMLTRLSSLICSNLQLLIYGELVLLIYTHKLNLMESPSSETSHLANAMASVSMVLQSHQSHRPSNQESSQSLSFKLSSKRIQTPGTLLMQINPLLALMIYHLSHTRESI